MAADRASQYQRINSATTTQVKTGRGRLRRIVVNTPVASETIGLIDGTTGTTVNVGQLTTTADLKPFYIDFNIIFMNGLRIVTSGTSDITVVFE